MHKSPSRLALLALIFSLLATAAMRICSGNEPENKLEIVLRKPGDKAVITQRDGGAVISIESASGIGGAEIKREKGPWPKSITLNLAIKELEGFTVENGKLRLQTSAKHATPEVSMRTGNGKWKNIPAERAHHVPLKKHADGISIEIPALLLSEPETSLRVQWVDFYR